MKEIGEKGQINKCQDVHIYDLVAREKKRV